MKILLIGGSGRLGTELKKYLDCDAPSHDAVDITDNGLFFTSDFYDIVIHAAAYIDLKEFTYCAS